MLRVRNWAETVNTRMPGTRATTANIITSFWVSLAPNTRSRTRWRRRSNWRATTPSSVASKRPFRPNTHQ